MVSLNFRSYLVTSLGNQLASMQVYLALLRHIANHLTIGRQDDFYLMDLSSSYYDIL